MSSVLRVLKGARAFGLRPRPVPALCRSGPRSDMSEHSPHFCRVGKKIVPLTKGNFRSREKDEETKDLWIELEIEENIRQMVSVMKKLKNATL